MNSDALMAAPLAQSPFSAAKGTRYSGDAPGAPATPRGVVAQRAFGKPNTPESPSPLDAPAAVRELYPVALAVEPVRQVPQEKTSRNTPSELGMATAEYAIATLAAVGFAGILVVILRSEEVRGFLLNLIRTALSLP
jgi:hypothetical protein